VNSRTTNRVTYSLDSTLESVVTAEKTAFEMAGRTGFAEEERHQIAMAVREAAVNAVLDGNSYDPHKKFFVAYEMSSRALVITVTDQGKGLDETMVPDPLDPMNLMKYSGRGIFLMKSFMDEVTIRNLQPGTEITLVKHLNQQADVKEESK